MAEKERDLPRDLRVPFATYAPARSIVQKMTALFHRLQPLIWDASDESAEKIEAVLAELTKGQRATYAVEQLQMEVGNGGFDQFFFNSAGALAAEALEGLQLLDLGPFASLAQRAFSLFPDGRVPRHRGERQQLLEDGLSEQLRQASLDREWYAAYAIEEQISKAVLAYVDAHPEEFFVGHGRAPSF